MRGWRKPNQLLDTHNVTIYSYIVTKHEKLLHKAFDHPDTLSFKEFQNLLKRCGWILDHQTGSHQIWYSQKKHRLSIQNRHGKAKTYQVKQFLFYFENEQTGEEP